MPSQFYEAVSSVADSRSAELAVNAQQTRARMKAISPVIVFLRSILLLGLSIKGHARIRLHSRTNTCSIDIKEEKSEDAQTQCENVPMDYLCYRNQLGTVSYFKSILRYD